MQEVIMIRDTVVASKISIEGNLIATYQIITSLQNNLEIEKEVESKKQNNRIISTEEAIKTLDLV